MTEPQIKILIIRFSSIGDILLTTPFIRQIKIQYPDAQVDYLIKSGFSELLNNHPSIDKLYYFNPDTGLKGLIRLAKRLKKNGYSHVFDLHNNFRSKIVRWIIPGSIKRSIHKDKLKRAFLVILKINRYNRIIPIPERYRRVGEVLSIRDDNKGLEFYRSEKVVRKIEKLIGKKPLPNIFIIAPGAGHFTKRWPILYFQELSRKLMNLPNSKIYILGSAEEKELFREFSGDNIANLAGELSLAEAGELIAGAQVVISNDSGLMHMATAVGTPVVALFGSTVRELGFFPYRSNSFVFENNNLSCRPCSHLGKKECPKKHFLCMNSILPEKVFSMVKILAGLDRS